MFVAVTMCMAMEYEIDGIRRDVQRVFGVVQDEDSATCPIEGARWQAKIEAESCCIRSELRMIGDVIVPENPIDGRVELGQGLEDGGLGEISCVDDAIHADLIEQIHDPFHIGHSVMCVAHDANPHRAMLSRRCPRMSTLAAGDHQLELGETLMADGVEVAGSGDGSLETMLVDKSDGVMTITLNRPERLNAFTMQMATDWFEVLDDADGDDDVRAVIVTGAGRGFCAGADLSSGGAVFDPVFVTKASGADPEKEHRDEGGLLTLRLYRCRKPLIAAVNGPAVGVGVTSILPMDIRLASTKARFGFVFARRGVVPEACSSWFLPRVVGINRAMEWVATGRVFDADEALRGGLVSELLAPDELLPRARELALEIAQNTSAVSVALARQMMWQMLGASHPIEAHRLDSKAMNYMGAREDSREGVTSFLEKRGPDFKMRISQDFPEDVGLRAEPPYEP